MKATNWAAVVVAIAMAAPALAQSVSKRVIIVSLEDRKLALVQVGQVEEI